MSIDWWMNKEDMVYINNGILLNHQKEWNLAICNNMDGARVYCAKQNKSIRETQIPYDLTHMWDLRNKTGEPMGGGKEREREREREREGDNH